MIEPNYEISKWAQRRKQKLPRVFDVAFYEQGNFTICVLIGALNDTGRSVGVAKRRPIQKLSKKRPVQKGDLPDRNVADRLALWRALDNIESQQVCRSSNGYRFVPETIEKRHERHELTYEEAEAIDTFLRAVAWNYTPYEVAKHIRESSISQTHWFDSMKSRGYPEEAINEVKKQL